MQILIIEDEINATERLEKLLLQVAPEKKVMGKCTGVADTLQWLSENPYPDLILSDVQLTDGLSFEIFQQLEKKVPVIFISAYDTYAINAFQTQGLHYILKPVKADELQEAINRHDKIKPLSIKPDSKTNNSGSQKFQERFIVHVGPEMKLIEDRDIAYIYAENKMVYMVTFNNDKFSIDIPLEKFDSLLNSKLFYRISRQFIVQLKAIVKMEPASKQRIQVFLHPACKYETITSFERTPNFKKWLLGDV